MAKARKRAARERQERLEQALKEFNQLAEEGKDKEKRRVSTSDPESRVMKQPDGGFAPSYNVEIDTDAKSGVVVAVGVGKRENFQLESGRAMAKFMVKNSDPVVTFVVSSPGQYRGDEGTGN